MKSKFKIIFIVLCCLFVTGCTDIKVISSQQKSKDEVIKFVKDILNDKYDNLEIKLKKVDKAYTVNSELIKNANNYYFEILDKDGNIAYASYRDAFINDEEVIDYSFIETYGAIYNNNELDYYKFLADKYINANDVKSIYYASDYEEAEYYNKAKVVFKLKYGLSDMNVEQYANLIKLGFDLRKYRIANYGTISYDDPEIYLMFDGSDQYYYVSYYGLIEYKGTHYDMKTNLINDYNDTYNLKSYINFNVSDEEYNKMINNFNSMGKYLLDYAQGITSKVDDKNAYILIDNKTRNDYYLGLLIKFIYDSKNDTYIYKGFSLLDSDKFGNFDGYVVKRW